MTITDESRFHLHQRLAEVLGQEEASTLMEHLPPVGWADVATRRDLDHAFTHLEATFDRQLAYDGLTQRRAPLVTAAASPQQGAQSQAQAAPSNERTLR